MKRISTETLINEMCNGEIYMFCDHDNDYCDWWLICIADGRFTCCAAWEEEGELRFCLNGSKLIQYTQVDMEYVNPALTVAEIFAIMSGWYEQYMDLSKECACPGFRVFDVADRPESVLPSGYRILPGQEVDRHSVDGTGSEYDR